MNGDALMPRRSELSDRIDELHRRRSEITPDELGEIVQYESDERITPLDNFNIGLIFHVQAKYKDSIRCFSNALDAYETPQEKIYEAVTAAYIGDAFKSLGNEMIREGDIAGAKEFHDHSSKAYTLAIEKRDFLPEEFLPTVLANAAIVAYNSGKHSQALQICLIYQTLQSTLSDYVTEKTDNSIELIFTHASGKVKPIGNG